MRQNLDAWDRYSYYTNQTYKTTGQSSMRESALVVAQTTGLNASQDAAVTVGVDAHSSGVSALTGTGYTAQALAVGDTIRIGNGTYVVTTGAAAGAVITGVRVGGSNAAVTASNALAINSAKLTPQGQEYQAKRWSPTLDTINISAHSIDIYKEFPTAFFNSYTTYHYGGFNLNAPKDVGSLFIPFCLYPGTYQPSGHINISRAREFYLTFSSAFFGSGSVSASSNGCSTTNGFEKCICLILFIHMCILGQVMINVMASRVRFGNISKLRGNPVMC